MSLMLADRSSRAAIIGLALLGLLGTMACATSAAAPAGLGQRTKTSGCASQGGLPDPACTPGAADPRVTQATIGSTICAPGYTATVRPPANVTDKIKREQMIAYGLHGKALADFELDHLVGLELGGAPADVANLWPEPRAGEGNAREKDAVENFLHREVCRGAMQLSEAQRQIATDWLAVYRNHGLQPTP